MAYTLDHKCAKNCCKRTIRVQLIVENVVTCFLRHSVDVRGLIRIRIAPKMLRIHCLVSVTGSHFVECCENGPVTV